MKVAFLSILCLSVLCFTGCGENPTTTSNASNASNASAPNAAPANKEPENKTGADSAPAASPALSEAEMEKALNEDISGIDTSKPMTASEVFDKFSANESELKDKKIAVAGIYGSYATSSSAINPQKPAYRVDLKGDKGGVACISRERPKEIDAINNRKDFSKDVHFTVTGVVRSTVDSFTGKKAVALEPCEIVRMEEK